MNNEFITLHMFPVGELTLINALYDVLEKLDEILTESLKCVASEE